MQRLTDYPVSHCFFKPVVFYIAIVFEIGPIPLALAAISNRNTYTKRYHCFENPHADKKFKRQQAKRISNRHDVKMLLAVKGHAFQHRVLNTYEDSRKQR